MGMNLRKLSQVLQFQYLSSQVTFLLSVPGLAMCHLLPRQGSSKMCVCGKCAFMVLSVLGWSLWSADVHPCVPGTAEEGGIHLQYKNWKESSSTEACTSSC